MARVYLKGLPQLKAKLQKLRDDTAKDVAPVMGQAAQQIVDLMKRSVPVDRGLLRDSIGWTFGDAPRYAQRVAEVKAGKLRVTIFAGNERVRYAHLVEFGTAPHPQGGQYEGTQHPGTRAQPFFFNSYRMMRKDVKKMLRKAIRDAVRKAVA